MGYQVDGFANSCAPEEWLRQLIVPHVSDSTTRPFPACEPLDLSEATLSLAPHGLTVE